jgi:tetratricopeptide (TPR) repeat protein
MTVKRLAYLTLIAISISLFAAVSEPSAAGQTPTPAVSEIESLIRSRQYDQALQMTTSALKQQPTNFRIWTLKGIILSMQGKTSDAQHALESALRISPQYPPAMKAEAQLLYLQNDKRAIPLLKQLLKADSNDLTAHEMLAVLERREEKCEDAVAHFEASRDAIDKHAESLEAYGYCLVQMKRFQDAVPVFEKLVSLLPDREYPKYDLAVALLASKQNEQALRTLSPMIGPDQRDPDILSLASEAAEANKDTPKAVELLRRAIVLNPTNADYYVSFATLCLDHDSFQVGIDMLNAGLARNPNTASLYISRGLLHAQLTEYDLAESDFARAEQLDANQSLSSYAADLAQVQKNNPDEALRRVRLQLKEHPESALLHYLLAQLLMTNDPEPGSSAYQEALREDLRALELQPRLVNARDLLASIYMRDEKYEQAIEQCRIALQDAPTDEAATYHLMVSLRHTGQKDELQPLVKRLSELHQQSLKNENDRKRYRLVEQGVPSNVAPPAE